MFFWSHVDVMENSKMLPSNRITHFSGPDHQPLPLAMPWYSSSSSYAPMAAAASGLVVVVVLVEEALVEEMPVSKLSLFWRTKNTLDTSNGTITPVSSTQLVHTSSNSCQGRFVINFQGKKSTLPLPVESKDCYRSIAEYANHRVWKTCRTFRMDLFWFKRSSFAMKKIKHVGHDEVLVWRVWDWQTEHACHFQSFLKSRANSAE